MSLTVTHLPDRTPALPARVASMEDLAAGLASIAAQLEEAFARGEERGEERGWAECARRYGLPQAAGRPRHLSSVPVGGAS